VNPDQGKRESSPYLSGSVGGGQINYGDSRQRIQREEKYSSHLLRTISAGGPGPERDDM